MLACVPSGLVPADDEADVLEVLGRAVAVAEDVPFGPCPPCPPCPPFAPFAPFAPVPWALDVVEVATVVRPRLREGNASGTAGGGDEGCIVLVVVWEGGLAVARAVVALVALAAVVVSAGPLPFGPVVEVALGPGEGALDALLDAPPLAAAGTGMVVEVAGALLVVVAPGRLVVEVVVAAGAGEVVAKGATEGLVELVVEPGTVLAVMPETFVEVVVAGAAVGEVVPGGAPGTLVEVELVEVTLVWLVGRVLAPEVVVVVPRTLVELVVLVEVGALVRVDPGQGGLAWRGWVVVVCSPRTVVLVLLGRGLAVVVVVALPAGVVIVAAGATVVCVHKVVVVVEDAAPVEVATEVVVVPALVAAAAVAVNDTAAYATARDASASNKLEALRAALHPQPRDGKAHPGHTPHR